MATKIGRSFDELSQKVKQFNSDLKSSQAQVRQLDADLKLNPGNVDAVRQKFTLLSNSLQTNTVKIATLKQQQAELTQAYEAGNINSKTYNSQLAKIAKQISATEEESKKLTEALKKQNTEMDDARLAKFTSGLTKVENGAKKVSVAVLGAVAALAAMMKSSISTADALNDTANKYQTTAENLQIWTNRLTMMAGDTQAYVSSLARVGSMMTSITAGRGARYIEFLNQLGISTEAIQGKTNAEVFDLIYNGLRQVTDETQRATIAQGLLGDTGLEIAVIAGVAQEAIDGYDSSLIESGVISGEQAAIADQLANRWAELQFQFQSASAELMVALVPAFETLCGVLETTVIPIVNNLAERLDSMSAEEQQQLMSLLMFIVVLPKIITLIKGITSVFGMLRTATMAQTAATGALNAVSSPWLGIIMAISVALMGLVSLMGVFNSSAQEAVDNANAMLGSINGLQEEASAMAGELAVEAQNTFDTNNHKTLDINVNVEATGDTPISQENADLISSGLFQKIDAEAINTELGSIIK